MEKELEKVSDLAKQLRNAIRDVHSTACYSKDYAFLEILIFDMIAPATELSRKAEQLFLTEMARGEL